MDDFTWYENPLLDTRSLSRYIMARCCSVGDIHVLYNCSNAHFSVRFLLHTRVSGLLVLKGQYFIYDCLLFSHVIYVENQTFWKAVKIRKQTSRIKLLRGGGKYDVGPNFGCTNMGKNSETESWGDKINEAMVRAENRSRKLFEVQTKTGWLQKFGTREMVVCVLGIARMCFQLDKFFRAKQFFVYPVGSQRELMLNLLHQSSCAKCTALIICNDNEHGLHIQRCSVCITVMSSPLRNIKGTIYYEKLLNKINCRDTTKKPENAMNLFHKKYTST